MKRVRPAALIPALLLAGGIAGCGAEYPQSTFQTVTDFGHGLNDLLAWVFWWTMLVLVVVVAVLVFVVLRYRERPGQPPPRQIHGHTGLEILWTLIPAVIVLFIAVPTVRGIFDTYQAPPEGALVIDVTGYQFWWRFSYPEYGIETASDLVVPVGRPIHLRLRSNDVVHSFWIPRFGGKRDVNPAGGLHIDAPPKLNHLVFTVDEPGVYPGQCAEFCGMSHAIMRLYGVALMEADFEAWTDAMRTPVEPEPGTLEAQGLEIFSRSACIACHAVEGTTAMGVLGPSLTLFGRRQSVGAGLFPNTQEHLVAWLLDPEGLKPGSQMPHVPMTDEEREAVAAYLLSLR